MVARMGLVSRAGIYAAFLGGACLAIGIAGLFQMVVHGSAFR